VRYARVSIPGPAVLSRGMLGQALCRQRADIHDEMTPSKSDTSTVYTSFCNVHRH
jgi:hypothetical protein